MLAPKQSWSIGHDRKHNHSYPLNTTLSAPSSS